MKIRMKTGPFEIVSRSQPAVVSAGSVTCSAQGNEMLTPPNAEELSHLSGDFVVYGSSTVYLVTAAAAEEFLTFAPDVHINVRFSGTSGGFDRFCAGDTEMQDASRPIKPEEAAACAENGIEYIELPVAIAGLTVVVNSENDWVDCLTVEELRTVWQPESEGIVTNWSQVRPGFPNAPLQLYGAGGRSGTFDSFTEAINGTTGASRLDYVSSEDDTELVAGVSNDHNAPGYVSYACYVENQEHLKAVPIRNPVIGTCTAPSEESVIAGGYQPLSCPLFIYVRADQAKQSEINAFVNFYLSPAFTPVIDSPRSVTFRSRMTSTSRLPRDSMRVQRAPSFLTGWRSEPLSIDISTRTAGMPALRHSGTPALWRQLPHPRTAKRQTYLSSTRQISRNV